MKTCCFFGSHTIVDIHNSDRQSIQLKDRILENIINLIKNHDVTHFISGMGIKIGLFAADTVLSLKQKYPHITLECALSYEEQAARYPAALHEKFYDILEKCDNETLLQRKYTETCRHERNEYMVDKSDYVIAVWNGKLSSKSISRSVNYAKLKNKQIIMINPDY